jgi:hypothetical protein
MVTRWLRCRFSVPALIPDYLSNKFRLYYAFPRKKCPTPCRAYARLPRACHPSLAVKCAPSVVRSLPLSLIVLPFSKSYSVLRDVHDLTH